MSVHEIEAAAQRLDRGHGPFAVDAERASGFRYSNRAYLIQIRRAGAGTVLIDPVSHGADPLDALRPVAEVLSNDEWILHSADQDLPCLAEVGMRPPALYDTELAGRLAGFDRVNLATMVERLLGVGLAKGHGAADWSKRPLPAEWLNYAALDVELLIELRAAIADVLAEQGKTRLGRTGIRLPADAGVRDPGAAARRDRWRRTSGIHRVRDQRGLAAVRELWLTRDRIAQRRDIAPRRILPDSAIIDAAPGQPDRPSTSSSLCRYSAGATSAAAPRRGWRRWTRPGEPRTRPGKPSRRTVRRRRRDGAGANRRPPPGWRRRARRCRRCRERVDGSHREPGLAGPGATAVLGLDGRRRTRSGRRRRGVPARRAGPALAAGAGGFPFWPRRCTGSATDAEPTTSRGARGSPLRLDTALPSAATQPVIRRATSWSVSARSASTSPREACS